MLRGRAEMLDGGEEHAPAQALCRARYPQLRAMRLDELPVIALRIARVASWGDLSVRLYACWLQQRSTIREFDAENGLASRAI